MCGRYTLTDPDPRLLRFRFGLTEAAEIDQQPRYNVAPTDPVLAVRLDEQGERQPGILRWGLIPHYADPETFERLLINARAETVAEAPAFRDAFQTHRCLIVADGFYEWRTDPDGRKRPVHYTLAAGEPFAFAGLWASWRDPQADAWLDSCTIITTAANRLVAPVHDRMPVILPRAAEAAWLDPELDPAAVDALLVPYPAEQMHAAEASLLVNSVKNDGPELLDPLA